MVLPSKVVSSGGDEAARLAEEQCGLVLLPSQRLFADVTLAERADGSLAADTVKVICSRRNGKNVGLEVVQLYDTAVVGLCWVHTAHHGVTMRESFTRFWSLVESAPELLELVTLKYASPMTGYEVRFRNGGRIRFIARTKQSGRGLGGDKLAVDEDQDLSDEALGALLPIISANSESGQSQVVFLGSAPGPTAMVAHRMRRRGRHPSPDDDRFAYLEFSAPPDADLDDVEAWAQANPRLGYGMSVDFIRGERSAMNDEMFARERLSISPELIEELYAAWPLGAWDACCDPALAPDVGLVIGVDVHPDRTSAAVGVADALGRVELVDAQPGVGWVVERAVALAAKHNARVAVQSTGPAGALIPDLERAGVKVVPVTQGDVRAACGAFYDAVAARQRFIRWHDVLNRAAGSAIRKDSGDGWVFDRRAGADVSPLYAVLLARWAATSQPPEPAPLVMMIGGR